MNNFKAKHMSKQAWSKLASAEHASADRVCYGAQWPPRRHMRARAQKNVHALALAATLGWDIAGGGPWEHGVGEWEQGELRLAAHGDLRLALGCHPAGAV